MQSVIKRIVKARHKAIYFLNDTSSETVQRVAFSKVAASVIDGFDKVIYPDWETLFRSFNYQLFLLQNNDICGFIIHIRHGQTDWCSNVGWVTNHKLASVQADKSEMRLKNPTLS